MKSVFKKTLFSLMVPSIVVGSQCLAMEGKGGDILTIPFPYPLPQHHTHQRANSYEDDTKFQEEESSRRLKELYGEIAMNKQEEEQERNTLIIDEINSLKETLRKLNTEIESTHAEFQDDIFFPSLKVQRKKCSEQIEELEKYQGSVNNETSLEEIRRTIDVIRMEYSSVGSDFSYPVSLIFSK